MTIQATDFEPIYAALEARLKAVTGVKRVSRRLMHWSNLGAGEHPAIFIMQKGEQAVQEFRLPTKWRLKVEVYVYVHVGNSTTAIPSKALNAILGPIRAEFAKHEVRDVPEGFQGLAQHVWIEGEIEIFDGVLGAQAAAVIPIDILTV